MDYSLHLRTDSKEIRRFIRFAVVGGIGTLLDFGLLIVLKQFVGLPILLANSLSYLTGVVNNFTLNRLWTYPEARSRPMWAQFGQFLTVSLVGLALNDSLVGVLHEPMGYVAAKVLATVVILFWNFLANRYWTFRNLD